MTPYERIRGSVQETSAERSLLRLSGADAEDFLHRMSTNDLRGIADGEARRTAVVNEKGRLVDVVSVARRGSGLLVVGSPGGGPALSAWLEKFIIMDDVRIEGVEDPVRLRAFHGPDAPSQAGAASAEGGLVIPEDLGTVPGRLLLPAGVGVSGRGERGPASAGTGALPADRPPGRGEDDALDTVRIEEMVPAPGRELGPEVNPLEAGLKHLVSFTKGCYIGQEVIARLDTYRKLQRIIALFALEWEGASVPPSGPLFHGDREAGRITSVTHSPRHGGWIGLGYRRIRLHASALELRPATGGSPVSCRLLSNLPAGYEEYDTEE